MSSVERSGPVDGGELVHEVGAAAGAGAAADLAVDGADVHRAAGGVVGDVAVDRVASSGRTSSP